MPRPQKSHAKLLALNAGLLGVLATMILLSPADAQPAAARARGEYTMVAGNTNAGGPQAVYIVDASNQEMVAVRWDQGKQLMATVGYRSFGDDAKAQPGR